MLNNKEKNLNLISSCIHKITSEYQLADLIRKATEQEGLSYYEAGRKYGIGPIHMRHLLTTY